MALESDGNAYSLMDSMVDENVSTFKDLYTQVKPDPYFPYTQTIKNEKTPLIIDNGSYQCRVGWAIDDKPKMIFRNLMLKSKGRKGQIQEEISIGNDINNLELLRWSLRTQFDADVVTHFDAQEQILDHIFSHLSISSEQSIDHPILMTEAVCNPNYCRSLMSELLFECYHVPQIIYGVDSLFSYYCNAKKKGSLANTALIISSGYQTTHVLPFVDGMLDAANCKRINIGGAYSTILMQRLLQLKYPQHASLITLSRAQELVHDYAYVASNYNDALDQWSSPSFYRQNARKIQLPFNPITSTTNSNGKCEEKEKLRRQKQGQRLQELNARRRDKMLAVEEKKLQQLQKIKELEGQEDELWDALEEAELEGVEELNFEIDRLKASIAKRREKATNSNGQSNSNKRSATKAVYDLLDIPDEELTSEQIEKKKRQRMLKNASIGRERAKRERDERKAQKEAQEREEEQKRLEDFDGWLEGIRQQREEILNQRQQRRSLKQNMASRRSHAAQERMRIITKLADNTGVASGKGVKGSKNEEDTFGQNDEDWMVYKAINLDNSDSEKEETRLNELESLLKLYDENFRKEIEDNSPEPADVATRYQLDIGIERMRVTEMLFQPSIRGVEQAGLHSTIAFVLKHYPDNVQNLLAQNIFVTGGNLQYPNFDDRLKNELREIRPFRSDFKIAFADDMMSDVWYGAKQWLLDQDDLQSVSITRSDYEEKGGEYLKEHVASNRYIPSPKG
ncbi:Actin-related protein 5 [Trichoplax sp. H2]|nr:Actin-related protein 5 [Trichoplax sp. H2]|eukprot:RDD44462.1 Actin-related protein 5 [Trichoplax sp. H2]